MLIVIICTVLFSVSRQTGELLLNLLSILLQSAFLSTSPRIGPVQQTILEQVPKTMDTVLKRFNLESKTTTYAVCPTCHCNYPPTFKPGSKIAQYPAMCSNVPSPSGERCDTPLLETGLDGHPTPVKTYIYHHFHDYLAGLISRSSVEHTMDHFCDNIMASVNCNEPPPIFVSDVSEAEFVRTFKGPDGHRLFIDRPGDEGRYLFAFNFDFFSAESQTIRGPSASCGITSAACLNLPLSIRYKPENMYIGIIPGPAEPHGTALNHYIRPVVDDLLTSWTHGVRYSRTANHPHGRMTRSAIALVACDLPAARKFSQYASVGSHHLCTRCSCFGLSNLGRTDIEAEDWEPRDRETMLLHANAWKAAESVDDQKILFEDHGVRWSEMWRLPYWDPARMVVVDSMHCLFEGLALLHFRDALKLTSASAKAKETPQTAFSHPFIIPDENMVAQEQLDEKTIKDISAIHSQLVSPISGEGGLESLTAKLVNRKLSALKFVFESLETHITVGNHPKSRYTKADYSEALTKWVRILFSRSLPGTYSKSLVIACTLPLDSISPPATEVGRCDHHETHSRCHP